jgi:hypothetical protein
MTVGRRRHRGIALAQLVAVMRRRLQSIALALLVAMARTSPGGDHSAPFVGVVPMSHELPGEVGGGVGGEGI